MTDAYTPPIGTVVAKVKDQYGQRAYHPVNSTAHILADIAGTKTLTTKTLKCAMLLGYAIEYQIDEVKL